MSSSRSEVHQPSTICGSEELIATKVLSSWIVAGRHDCCSTMELALSRDGVHFEPAVAMVPESGGAMPDVNRWGKHGLAYSYQTPSGEKVMACWVRISPDCKTWSEPIRITDSSMNVHDTAQLPRADGGVDLYYIYATPKSEYRIFRRKLPLLGGLGAEQVVSSASLKNLEKPFPSRLASGKFSSPSYRPPSWLQLDIH